MNFTKGLCGSPKMYGFVSPYFEYALYSYNSLLIVVSNQCEDAAKVSLQQQEVVFNGVERNVMGPSISQYLGLAVGGPCHHQCPSVSRGVA